MTNPDSSSRSGEPQPPVPWWRVPMVWLVVGGPAVVVVASVATGVIAGRHADPVVPHDEGAYQSTAHIPAAEHHLDAPHATRHP
jgi:hypothetical protein